MRAYMDHESTRTTCGHNTAGEPCEAETAAHWAMSCACGSHSDHVRLCAEHDAEIAEDPPEIECVDCELPMSEFPHQCAVVLVRWPEMAES